MAGANLRVATLKNANLQNCDLRAAVLAGADLEVIYISNLLKLIISIEQKCFNCIKYKSFL